MLINNHYYHLKNLYKLLILLWFFFSNSNILLKYLKKFVVSSLLPIFVFLIIDWVIILLFFDKNCNVFIHDLISPLQWVIKSLIPSLDILIFSFSQIYDILFDRIWELIGGKL